MPKDNPHYPKDEAMQVKLNYNPKTGAITDRFGTLICTWESLNYIKDAKAIPAPTNLTRVDQLCQLKQAGFTTENIIQLSYAEVLK